MAISRYRNLNILGGSGGSPQHFETPVHPTQAQIDAIPTFKLRVPEGQRLDILAFKHLGAGEYWWAIALVNNIGWMFNIPANTILKIPLDVQDVLKLF